MTKIGLGGQPLSPRILAANAYVRRAKSECAFIPVVAGGVGVEALIEGLRLADIEGFIEPHALSGDRQFGEDVVARDVEKFGPDNVEFKNDTRRPGRRDRAHPRHAAEVATKRKQSREDA